MTPDEIDPADFAPPLDPEAAGAMPPRPSVDTGQIPPRRTPRPMQSPPFPVMRPSKRLSADLDRAIGEQGISQEPPPYHSSVAPAPETGAQWQSHQVTSPAPQAQYPPPQPYAPPAQGSSPDPGVPNQQATPDPYADLQSAPPAQESPWKWIVIAVVAGLVAIGSMIGIAFQRYVVAGPNPF